jgi:DNA-binding NarL/FixJ family response regulator
LDGKDGVACPLGRGAEGTCCMKRHEERIGVLVADDDMPFRRVVAATLADRDDIAVVGEAGDGNEAVTAAIELVPDVVLLDVSMPGGGGIEAARAIHKHVPTTKIVMLTASDTDEDVYGALKAGASGYVLKEGFIGDLAGVIRAMAQGVGVLLSPSVAGKVLDDFRHDRTRHPSPALSEREVEVLRLVAQGCTNDEIAHKLCLSSHTVKRHVANILAKLHERTRTDAVMRAMQQGVLA